MSNEGIAARNLFMDQQASDRFYKRGRYNQETLYASYKEKFEELVSSMGTGAGSEAGGAAQGEKFLNAVNELNNEFMGLGLAGNYLSSGAWEVSSTTRIINSGLINANVSQTTVEPIGDVITQSDNSYDDKADAISMNIWNSNHREYVNKWREEKRAKQDVLLRLQKRQKDIYLAQQQRVKQKLFLIAICFRKNC